MRVSLTEIHNQVVKSTCLMQKVTFEALCDLVEASHIIESLDIGVALIHKAIHPTLGNLTIVNSTGEAHAVVYG